MKKSYTLEKNSLFKIINEFFGNVGDPRLFLLLKLLLKKILTSTFLTVSVDRLGSTLRYKEDKCGHVWTHI